jgi:LysM repeat protein
MKTRMFTFLILISLLLGMFAFPRDAEASDSFCHVVQRGENVTMIARKYGVTVAAIQQANNLWNPSLIYVGQCLWIPTSGPPATGCVQVHIVKRGEYLKSIAPRYGVTWQAIAQANGLKSPYVIFTGQRLKIPCAVTPPPKPPPQPPSTTCTKTHVVKRGEYLKSIAPRYGVTWQAIAQANGLKSPYVIYTGQRLKIPVPCPKPSPEPTPKPGTGPWQGEYWNNRFLSGNPKFTRKDQVINFTWGTNGPGGSIGGTDFSARWTRSKPFDSGRYRFYVTVDDGVRVWVDGMLIIDQWHDTAPKTYHADRQLSGGSHNLKVDYYQNKGGAQIRFWVERIDGEGAWKGEFFNNTKLEGTPATTQHYSTIDFDWGNKAPVYGVTADYFSVRFTSEFQFDGGKYRFFATMDDGLRLYVDDELILDQWRLGSARTHTADKDLSQGKHRVKVEYYENTGDAVCKVRWTQQ